MAYTVTPTNLTEVLILEPQVFGDDRGFFGAISNLKICEVSRYNVIPCSR